MISMPLARACFTVSFNGPAISPTRRAADLHQWSSHMSQITSAVLFGSHSTFFSTTVKRLLSVFEGICERNVRAIFESAASMRIGVKETTATARRQADVRTRQRAWIECMGLL